MAGAAEVEVSESSHPLELTVDKLGSGGVTGLAPTVAIRNAATLNSYLDFADNTFKTSGWATKYAPMSEVERGHYQRLLNVNVLSLAPGARLAAEYHVDSGSGIVGDDLDLLLLTDKRANISLTRKYHTNRMHEASGNPGTLTLFDDDDATVLRTHQLRDEAGGTIAPTTLTPARRSRGT